MKPLQDALKHARHIQLRRLPPLTTTADLKRIFAERKLAGIADVALLYKRFRPTGDALVALKSPSHLEDNLRGLKDLDISGVPVKYEPTIPPDSWDYSAQNRSRGHKGRKEAAERGVWNGDGPRAGVRGVNIDRVVTIWGFPGKATTGAVEKFLEEFEVARSKEGEAMIYKFPLPPGAYSMYSRFVAITKSAAEANRVVQTLHKTQLPKKPHTIYAQLIY